MDKRLFLLIVPVLLLASCQREIDWSGAPEIKATVETESKTRTSLSVDETGAGTIYWNQGDQIDVFFGTKKAGYTSQNTSDVVSAVFKTTATLSDSDLSSTNIWGLYPSNSSSSCNGSSVTTTLPSTQYGVPNTFDDDLFLAVAHSTTRDLQFYNVCGGIKFNLAYDDIKKVTFRGNNNENLAGTVSISFVNNVPQATIVNGVKEITLTPKTGTTFTKGTDYYFTLLPGTLSSGFTMTFTATDGTTGTLNYTDKSVTIKRSVFARKGNMDVYAAFADERQPNNVIYYTSSDGQIVSPYKTNVFGASIVSNEYVGGRGIITFDGDVTTIGYLAFDHCRSLSAISIPHSVTSIGNGTFDDCSLTSFVLPSSVISFSKSFGGCNSLESIIVEPGNPVYDSRNNCNAIIESNSNTLIDGCKNSFIPNSVTSIGYRAFEDCRGLTSIVIPNSVTDIGVYSFFNTGLTSIEIPNSVNSIGYGAFYGTYLTSISIPESVTSIGTSGYGQNPFLLCSNLASIAVNPDNPIYDSRNGCNAIIITGTNELISGCKNTVIPNSVTSIGGHAFYYCSYLTGIEIPNSVASIGEYAFLGCSGLATVDIPNSVTSIGKGAFSDCYGLTSITVYATTPPSGGSNMFDYTNNCPIYVPAASVETYKNAQYWSDYSDRIQAIHEYIDLGLSVKWATCNLGATEPEEYGDYYAWGETEPYYGSQDPLTWKDGKTGYNWASYQWCNGIVNTLTRYCPSDMTSFWGGSGAPDGKTEFSDYNYVDDAARQSLGGKWRMPTDAEWTELRQNCSWTWTTQNGVTGYKVTSNNTGYTDKSIFLPAAGYRDFTNLFDVGSYGDYWSSTLNTDLPYSAWCVSFYSSNVYRSNYNRYFGFSVRPVTE